MGGMRGLQLGDLAGFSTYIIAGACAVHLFALFVLWAWSRRDLKKIASSVDEFTRDIRHRSVLDSTGHLSDQIEAFLADVNEILNDPSRTADRALLLQRIKILDEKRGYLHALPFETAYNTARTMIEAYPLAGVLGTILAIGAALQTGGDATSVGSIVSRFGDAIWSTFAGLAAAILLMFINSMLEPRFSRLAENRANVRDMIARAKRELAMQQQEGS